jgi:hypothetical protein
MTSEQINYATQVNLKSVPGSGVWPVTHQLN